MSAVTETLRTWSSTQTRGVDEAAPAHPPLVLVPLDGSPEARTSIPVARLMVRIVGVAIHVIHSPNGRVEQGPLLDRLGFSREELKGLVLNQVHGPPGRAIVREAARLPVAVIVMSTHGRAEGAPPILGPVAEEVIRKVRCPVLLVRPEIGKRVAAMESFKRVLLPLDGSPSVASVAGPALDLARRSDAGLDIVYVAGPRVQLPPEPGTLTTPRYVDQPQHEWPAWAREFLGRFCARLGECRLPGQTRLAVRRGDPATEILRFAEEHGNDLIALEWRGRLDAAHAAVVRAVLKDSPSPVLLLRAGSSTGRQTTTRR